MSRVETKRFPKHSVCFDEANLESRINKVVNGSTLKDHHNHPVGPWFRLAKQQISLQGKGFFSVVYKSESIAVRDLYSLAFPLKESSSTLFLCGRGDFNYLVISYHIPSRSNDKQYASVHGANFNQRLSRLSERYQQLFVLRLNQQQQSKHISMAGGRKRKEKQ